jgi:hypothetical protein
MRETRPSTILRLPLGIPEDHRASPLGISLAIVFVIAAVAAAFLPLSALSRGLFGAALLGCAFASHRFAGRLVRAKQSAPGYIAVDEVGISRLDGSSGSRVIARYGEPFGLSILANRARSRLVLAFTTRDATRLVGVRVSGLEDAAGARTLLAHASTVAESDVVGVRGEREGTLSATDAEQLLLVLRERAPAALDRIYLSDPHGGQVVLDGKELRLGERAIDLTMPLEWRGFMFHESGGRVTTIYQATWVRQSEAEAVLVSPLPLDSSWARDLESARSDAHRGDERASARDIRLMHSSPDEPPPRDLRLAIDRLFMLPLRQALDRAPRISRAPSSTPSRAMPEGRA